ncbi:MAG: hypothetical protein MK240_05305, partial [Opitutales bacterium]|nr:hypothetical protein [Opitutales bacterium]
KYNLRLDIGEDRNLSESMPEKAQELLAQLNKWRKRLDAPVNLEPNPKFDQALEAEARKGKVKMRPKS